MNYSKILFIVDVRNWAYHHRAKVWQELLKPEFDIDIIFLEDYQPCKKNGDIYLLPDETEAKPIFNHEEYDGIVFFYHRAIKSAVLLATKIPLQKTAICINNSKWYIDGPIYTHTRYFKNVKLLIACNSQIIEAFSRFHSNIARASQAVDERIFRPAKPNIINPKNRGHRMIVGWCGNYLSPFKNVDWLKRACKGANVRLSIQKDLSLQELSNWYNEIDVAACVSYPNHEGGPNIIMEAGACRVPVVTTSVGLVPEIIIDGKNGIITPHHRLDLLIKNLMRLSMDLKLRTKLAINLYSTVTKEWTYSKRLYEIRNALKRLVEK